MNLFVSYDMFRRLSQTMDSTILFEMFDNSPRHSYGIVEKTVRDLLAGTSANPDLGWS